ncbi:MAG: ABC transporter substrate-binding protein [Pseudomonadota bacterium]
MVHKIDDAHNSWLQISWLQEQLTCRSISRREFVGRAAALGVTTALASSLAGQAIQAAEPKRGGEMKLAMKHGETSDTIDPAALVNGYQWALGYAMRDTLTEIAPGGKVVPSLAESWESSPDATTWSFALRDGVEFHNGKSLTTDDVIASINHHRLEDSKSFLKPIAGEIEDISADGNIIKISLKAGNADFPFTLASAGFTICPAGEGGGIDWSSGQGTGGYLLDRYEPGVSATLTRNPNYWNSNAAFADRVEFFTIIDSTARSNALITGEVDAIDQVDLKTVGLLGRKEGIVVEETAGPLHFTFPMRMDTAPFDDNNVRQALKHAINREEMLQKILKGHGSVGNDNPIGPSYRYYDKDLAQTPYDVDKAKWHLQQAGLSELKVDLSASDAAFAGAVDAATLYRESALPAGIDITIVREPNDGYWSNVWMKKPWAASYWGGYTTENEMFTTGYSAGAAWNDTWFDDETFTKLMIEARAELDADKRAEMYGEMQRILRDEGGAIVPMFANDVMARNERVAHGELANDRGFDGRRIISRWWVV